MIKLIKIFLFFIFSTISLNVFAIQQWTIVPKESSITFSGIQNDAPTEGKFTRFSGDIQFDPDKLNESKVKIVVDTNSVSTSYSDLTSTLMNTDWLSTKQYPQAIFVADHFKKITKDTYEAEGVLTIKNKSLPIKLTFEGKELSTSKARIQGQTIINRNVFNVGEGEWADPDTVKNEVKVNFIITATKK